MNPIPQTYFISFTNAFDFVKLNWLFRKVVKIIYFAVYLLIYLFICSFLSFFLSFFTYLYFPSFFAKFDMCEIKSI